MSKLSLKEKTKMVIITDNRFKEGDFIISHASGDMGVFNKIDKKGYVHFKKYYDSMFESIKGDEYNFHMNFLKFFELCNEEEIKQFKEILEDEKIHPEKYSFTLTKFSELI